MSRPEKRCYSAVLLTNDRRLVAQLFSALCSAAGQNLAAVRGRHSLAEAVLFLALTLLGLIGTEHRHNSFLNHTQQRPCERRSW